jgi:superfamily I DNA/RNA helicase
VHLPQPGPEHHPQGARAGYKPGFSIFDESDVKALMTDIMQKEYSGDDGVDEIKNMIGAWKNDLILPPEALENARNPANRPPPSSTPTTSARSRRSTRWTSTT